MRTGINPLQDGILQDIVEERERQRRVVAGAQQDSERSPGDWVGILALWLGKAAQETPLYRGSFSRRMFRSRLIQIAAICLAALEAIDDDGDES
jgi:hypothetical protein